MHCLLTSLDSSASSSAIISRIISISQLAHPLFKLRDKLNDPPPTLHAFVKLVGGATNTSCQSISILNLGASVLQHRESSAWEKPPVAFSTWEIHLFVVCV